MKTVPLRYLAEINPPSPEFDRLPSDGPVMFLPLEAVWSDERADQTRRALKEDVVSGYTRYQAGDIVCPKVTPTFQAGRSMIAKSTGAGTTELHVLRARPEVDARWIWYAVRSKHFLEEGVTAFQGVAGLQRAPQEFVAGFPVVDIDIHEQRRIADFLDDRVARIDQIIAARRHQKTAIQESARSERSDLVARSDAGWMAGPLRRFARSLDARRIPLSSEERSTRQGEFPYYGASGPIDTVDDYLFDGPSVLLAEDGANLLMRSTPIAFVAEGKYWVNNHAHILDPLDGVHHYWAARIEAMDVSPWVSGSAQPKLTIDAAMSLPVSAPPSVEDRRSIGRELLELEKHLRGRLQGLASMIELLSEYKQALITAAVTGELDVTTAGRTLPE